MKTNLSESLGVLGVHHKLPNSNVTDLFHLGNDAPALYCQPTKQHKQQVIKLLESAENNLFSYRALKRATIKMVCITGLFLLTVSPFCFVFAAAGFQTPESTRWHPTFAPRTHILNSNGVWYT